MRSKKEKSRHGIYANERGKVVEKKNEMSKERWEK